MKRSYGFTLIELMITVAVVAILAAIALPSYTDYIRRGDIAQGLQNLSEAKVRMEQYYASNRSYQVAGGATCGIDLSSLFTATKFNVTATPPNCATANQFVITMRGNAGSNVAGFTYTINQAGTRATTAVPASSGYTTSTTCWVRAKGGVC